MMEMLSSIETASVHVLNLFNCQFYRSNGSKYVYYVGDDAGNGATYIKYGGTKIEIQFIPYHANNIPQLTVRV